MHIIDRSRAYDSEQRRTWYSDFQPSTRQMRENIFCYNYIRKSEKPLQLISGSIQSPNWLEPLYNTCRAWTPEVWTSPIMYRFVVCVADKIVEPPSLDSTRLPLEIYWASHSHWCHITFGSSDKILCSFLLLEVLILLLMHCNNSMVLLFNSSVALRYVLIACTQKTFTEKRYFYDWKVKLISLMKESLMWLVVNVEK